MTDGTMSDMFTTAESMTVVVHGAIVGGTVEGEMGISIAAVEAGRSTVTICTIVEGVAVIAEGKSTSQSSEHLASRESRFTWFVRMM